MLLSPSFITRARDRWESQHQLRDLEDFTLRLKGMGDEEIAFLVAMAAHQRNHTSLRDGLLDPFVLVAAESTIPSVIERTIKRLEGEGHHLDANAWRIWLHTVRGVVRAELRYAVREMWRQLARGIPFVQLAMLNHRAFLGVTLDIDRAGLFPLGMEPPGFDPSPN